MRYDAGCESNGYKLDFIDVKRAWTVLASSVNLDWFHQRFDERFEVKFRGRLGPEQKDDKSIRILNRVVSWTRDEADQRHA